LTAPVNERPIHLRKRVKINFLKKDEKRKAEIEFFEKISALSRAGGLILTDQPPDHRRL